MGKQFSYTLWSCLIVWPSLILPGMGEVNTQWTNALKPIGDPGPELTLATDGRTDYRIIVPIKPTGQDAKAASE